MSNRKVFFSGFIAIPLWHANEDSILSHALNLFASYIDDSSDRVSGGDHSDMQMQDLKIASSGVMYALLRSFSKIVS